MKRKVQGRKPPTKLTQAVPEEPVECCLELALSQLSVSPELMRRELVAAQSSDKIVYQMKSGTPLNIDQLRAVVLEYLEYVSAEMTDDKCLN